MNRQPLQNPTTYTSDQAAKHMGLNPAVFRNICVQGHGPTSISLNGERRFRPESLNLWKLYGRGGDR